MEQPRDKDDRRKEMIHKESQENGRDKTLVNEKCWLYEAPSLTLRLRTPAKKRHFSIYREMFLSVSDFLHLEVTKCVL